MNKFNILKYLVGAFVAVSLLLAGSVAIKAETAPAPNPLLVPGMITSGNDPSSASGNIMVGILFLRSLALGSSGIEVSRLQNFLKAQGKEIYPEALVTGYFGNLTRLAIGRFQIKYGIVIDANSPGYGLFGPRTRAKVNELI